MAIASKEIIDAAENFIRYACQRKADLVDVTAYEDDEASFTCFHTSPKAPNEDIKSLSDYLRTAPIADAYNFNSEGWYIGDFAWVIGTLLGHCPDGADLDVRHTTILRHINGEWKVVHLHLSEGVVCRQHLYPEEYSS